MTEKQKYLIAGLFIVGAVLFSFGCSSDTKVVSDGTLYSSGNLGIEIVPPSEWVIREIRKFGAGGVAIYTSYPEYQARIVITRVKLISYSEDTDLSQTSNVQNYKRDLKSPKTNGVIEWEGEVRFGGGKAYYIESTVDFYGPEKIKAMFYFMIRNNKLYNVVCSVSQDPEY